MKRDKSSSQTPVPVLRTLRKIGRDIRAARRRRRIPVAILAERASISRMTLNKVEKGDPGVSAKTYATILFTLGMIERFADVADPRHDAIGRELDEEHLPGALACRAAIRRPSAQGQSDGKRNSRLSGSASDTLPGGTVVDAHPQRPRERHLRIRPGLASAS